MQFRTLGSTSCRDSVTALWGMKALDNVVDMDLMFEVERERSNLKRLQKFVSIFPHFRYTDMFGIVKTVNLLK